MIEPINLLDEETLNLLRQQEDQENASCGNRICNNMSHLVSEARLQELFDEIVMENAGANSTKDTPKKVVIREHIFKEFHPYCPTCNSDLIGYLGVQRCPVCNQALAGQDTRCSGQVIGYLWNGREDESNGESI